MHFSYRRVAIVAALVAALVVPPALAGSHPADRNAGKDAATSSSVAAQTAQEAPFEDVVAFATKTGTRGVVTWQTSEPISPVLTWIEAGGGEPEQLVVNDAPDTAGVGIIDNLEVGTTYQVTVTDQLTGATSTPIDLVATNAYTDHQPNGTRRSRDDVSWRKDVYTIDLLVQLDTQSLPEDIPHDQALGDIGDAFNVVAERMYDALDGHARLGHVLVTDTQFAYAVNEPFGVEEATTLTNEMNPCVADRNLADVLVQSTPPFDSHTFSYAIEEPCASFYVGRLGWLVANPWVNDLDMGYTSTHELMHYAFGAPDLYGTSDVAGEGGGCRNLDWDGSLMHNSGGWNGTRWELTELDRTPELTPCDGHETEPYTWDRIQSRYERVPDEKNLLDVVNYRPRGNPDGGALDIRILDRSPAGSTLTSHTIDDTNPEIVGDCGGRRDTSRSSVTDPEGDATVVAAADTGQAAANEPALDILGTDITYVDDGDRSSTDGDRLDVVISVDDLTATPRASSHIAHELRFTVDGTEYVASARKDVATGAETFAVAGVPIEGAFDVAAGTVTLRIPAVLANGETSVYALTPGGLFVPGATWSRRVVGPLAPVADQAAGGCEIRVPGTAGAAALGDPDAVLAEGQSYEWTAGPFFDVGEAAGACDVQAPCDPTDLQLNPTRGSALSVAIDMDDAMLSYQLIVSGPQGVVHESVESGDASLVAVVPSPGRYTVTVNPYWSAGGSYAATATLADVAVWTPPAPDITLSDHETWTSTGTSPSTNVETTCRPPDASGPDPACITYVVEAQPADGTATLSLELSADNPAEDWDLVLYDATGSEVTTIGAPATLIEFGDVEVPAGVYYLVVQPYIALEGSGFEVTVTARP